MAQGFAKEAFMGSIHLIRIPQREDRIKAIRVWRQVNKTRVRLPDDVMGVEDEHVQALRRAGIPFEFLSKEPNGQRTSAV